MHIVWWACRRHSNCVTFFHEFGHIMHGVCCEGEANATTLAKCPRDFVEAPSQMLENWVWTSVSPDGIRILRSTCLRVGCRLVSGLSRGDDVRRVLGSLLRRASALEPSTVQIGDFRRSRS